MNVPKLINTLRKYDHTDDVYLGKISLSSKMEVIELVMVNFTECNMSVSGYHTECMCLFESLVEFLYEK